MVRHFAIYWVFIEYKNYIIIIYDFSETNNFYGGRRIVDMEHVFAQILESSN